MPFFRELTKEDEMLYNSLHSLQELRENIRTEIASVSRQGLCHALRNIF
jgi:hypothetical protein